MIIQHLKRNAVGLQLKFEDNFPSGEIPCTMLNENTPDLVKHMIAQFYVSKNATVFLFFQLTIGNY